MTLTISKVQLFLLLFIVQTGFVYVSFQSFLIETAKRNTPFVFLFVACLFLVQLLIYEAAHRYFVFGKFVRLLYIIYWFCFSAIFVGYISYVLATWIFPHTPKWIVIIGLLISCLYASLSRVETAINLGVFVIPLIFIFVLFLLLAVPELQLTNLLPVGHGTLSSYLKGGLYATYGFTGAELYAVLRRFEPSKRISNKIILIYVTTLTFFHLFGILFVLMYFSLDEFAIIPEAILYLLNAQEVTFVKRLDIFFIYIWLIWCTCSLIYYAVAVRIFLACKKRKTEKIVVFFYYVAMGCISLFLVKFSILDFLKHTLIYAYILFSVVIPLCIIVVNKVRGKTISA